MADIEILTGRKAALPHGRARIGTQILGQFAQIGQCDLYLLAACMQNADQAGDVKRLAAHIGDQAAAAHTTSGGAGYQDRRPARGSHLDQQDLQIDHPDHQHRHAEQDADEPLIDAEEFEHRCGPRVQPRRRSACQATCSARKVEMK